jgi:hypothetical protein
LCVIPLGLGTYLLIRAGWWARWVGYVFYDATFVIGWLFDLPRVRSRCVAGTDMAAAPARP